VLATSRGAGGPDRDEAWDVGAGPNRLADVVCAPLSANALASEERTHGVWTIWSKRQMRGWAHNQILDYKAATGRLPPLNLNEW
jgi:hypothetical protein